MSEAPNPTITPATPDDRQSRDQSSIQFPYGDQNDAVAVSKAILGLGGGAVEVEQLAAALKQEPTSGSFRGKVATARTFSAITTVSGKYQLTEIGFALADAKREKAARVDSFLAVPLYKRTYEEFKGKQLPPRPVALEHAFVGFGVAPKQKEKARYAFERSAKQAGFFDHGDMDRLVKPTVGNVGTVDPGTNNAPPPPADNGDDGNGNGADRNRRFNSGGNGGGGQYHPFIEGLLATLPAPNTVWAIEGRAAWLEAAASAFKLLYKGDGKIEVKATPEKGALN